MKRKPETGTENARTTLLTRLNGESASPVMATTAHSAVWKSDGSGSSSDVFPLCDRMITCETCIVGV